MVTPELIETITTKFQKGQSRAKIKEDLMIEGWTEDDIDDAVAQMQKEALQQIPVVAYVTNLITTLDKKYAALSPKGVVIALSACCLFLLLIALGLYLVLDPLNTRAITRDTEREAMLSQVHTAILRYYNENHEYPPAMESLAPKFLSTVPVDPRTKKPLNYVSPEGSNYQLCIYFETRPVECVSGTATADVAPINPPVTAITSKYILNGVVFVDANANNIRDAGEGIYPTASVTVTDNAGKTVCDKVSDDTGSFICEINADGSYTATLQIPDGYTTKSPVRTATFPSTSTPSVKSSTVFFPIMVAITAQTTQSAPMVSVTAPAR